MNFVITFIKRSLQNNKLKEADVLPSALFLSHSTLVKIWIECVEIFAV